MHQGQCKAGRAQERSPGTSQRLLSHAGRLAESRPLPTLCMGWDERDAGGRRIHESCFLLFAFSFCFLASAFCLLASFHDKRLDVGDRGNGKWVGRELCSEISIRCG